MNILNELMRATESMIVSLITSVICFREALVLDR
jgi:hypothetical protein